MNEEFETNDSSNLDEAEAQQRNMGPGRLTVDVGAVSWEGGKGKEFDD